MPTSSDLLIITASNGHNLELAKRFHKTANKINVQAEIVDLTTIDLPLYNPRNHQSNGIPTLVSSLNQTLKSAPRWVICAPEYNGSIPPVLSSAIAWLSVQEEDFRDLFNGRPIAIASFSGGGGMELLLSLRIQLTHLGAQVVGRQLMSNFKKPPEDDSIADLMNRLMQMEPLRIN